MRKNFLSTDTCQCMTALSHIKESPTMRLINRKQEILSYFEPDKRDLVTDEIGTPPLDVSGVAYLLHGTGINNNQYWLESTMRTLEAIVKDGLLERYRSRETRNIILGGETTATVVRYGLPGTISVVRDTEGAVNAIAGECTRLS